jgi:Kef-type K+ transport system membrane component KefB
VAAVVLAGVTWISSSGVIAKVLGDLGRVGNRETPVILSVLVLEDLAMAVYLPIVTALVAGAGLLAGSVTLAIALGAAGLVLFVAVRYGHLPLRLQRRPGEAASGRAGTHHPGRGRRPAAPGVGRGGRVPGGHRAVR